MKEAVTPAPVTSTYHGGSLRHTLLFWFLFLALLPLLIVSFITYLSSSH